MFNEILEYLGAAPFLLLLIGIFWKGDDAVSKEFRDDLALWLLCLKTTKFESPWAQSAYSSFTRVFGSDHLSFRSSFGSVILAIISGTTYIALLSIFIPIAYFDPFANGINEYASNFFPFGSGYDEFAWDVFGEINKYGLFLSVSTIFLFANAVPTYFSLGFSRLALRKVASGRSIFVWLVSDILFAFALAILFSILTYWILISNEEFIQDNITNVVLIAALELSFETPFFLLSTVLTMFTMSFWIWGAGSGASLLRGLSRFDTALRAIQYVLPIETKPIRSIGIFIALIAMIILVALRFGITN